MEETERALSARFSRSPCRVHPLFGSMRQYRPAGTARSSMATLLDGAELATIAERVLLAGAVE